MTDGHKMLLGAGVITGLILLWLAWNTDTSAPAPTMSALGQAGITWGNPRRYGQDFDWLGAVLPAPHPVYRNWQPGACRTGLMQYGWSWVTDPPSEQGLS